MGGRISGFAASRTFVTLARILPMLFGGRVTTGGGGSTAIQGSDHFPQYSASRAPTPGSDSLVLIVDDEESVRQNLIDVLASSGIQAIGCSTIAEALELQAERNPAVAVVDFRLPDGSGIELSKLLKERDPELPVLLLAAFSSIDSAVASVGQLDAYLIKPVSSQTFQQATRNALARRSLVVENRSLEDRLQRLNTFQALYDPLTGLPNRALLDDRLGHALASAKRAGTTLAVLFIDLDTFKVVNDLFGHHVGDQLLTQMAARFAAARRSSDTVARFGGDEFVVVCPDVKTSAVAVRIAEHLLEQLAVPVVVDGLEHRLQASVGIALSTPRSTSQTPEGLLRNADIAMYRAKEAGGGAWELFDETMRDRVLERHEVEQELRANISGEDFSLAYQPVVELSTGHVVGAEALLRWHREGYGTMLPSTFLAVAEESGLIVQIGRWTLEKAMSDLAAARNAGQVPDSFRLWINVSPHQLASPRFAEILSELMETHGLSASMLGLDIVEEVLRDARAVEGVLDALREIGVSVNLDDFGAGNSNLSWLQQLPIAGLKIDRGYVSSLDAPRDGRGEAIVRGLLGLGHALGMSVVAEGVETQLQADALRMMGCELAQGYYFGYPGTLDQLWTTVKQRAGAER